VKLPTRKIDAKQLKKIGVPVANRTVEDPLALRKLEMEKLNAETLARAQLRDTRNKEMLENAAEQQAKRLARQQQIEGSTNLLSQIQNRASAESANLQQIQNQEQSLIQKSQSDTAAANAAVLKAEQAQLAKNTIIPVRRLPKSVKYGGGKKSILERLMTEFDMTLKEAKQLIKLYGI
jgi:type IV secretory pathway VirB10-like protein